MFPFELAASYRFDDRYTLSLAPVWTSVVLRGNLDNDDLKGAGEGAVNNFQLTATFEWRVSRVTALLLHGRYLVAQTAHAQGDVVLSIEGSATAGEAIAPGEDGTLAHTNHYVTERMRRYEGDRDYAVRSDVRFCRARDLLGQHGLGSVTPETLRTILSDHENQPDEVCRHPEFGHPDSKTVFWSVADVAEGRILFGRGNPCDSMGQEYVFAGYGEA